MLLCTVHNLTSVNFSIRSGIETMSSTNSCFNSYLFIWPSRHSVDEFPNAEVSNMPVELFYADPSEAPLEQADEADAAVTVWESWREEASADCHQSLADLNCSLQPLLPASTGAVRLSHIATAWKRGF